MNTTRLFASVLLIGVGSVSPGCSGGSHLPATYPVSGKVTYRGKPVAGASVAFRAAGAPRLAVGTTDDAGNFQLSTFEPNDGAVLGQHVITVSKRSSSTSAALPTAEEVASGKLSTEQINAAIDRAATAAAQSRSELPAKYADRNTSGLQREVVAGENFFEIELVD